MTTLLLFHFPSSVPSIAVRLVLEEKELELEKIRKLNTFEGLIEKIQELTETIERIETKLQTLKNKLDSLNDYVSRRY